MDVTKFKSVFNLLLVNYRTTHSSNQFKLYYECLKNYEFEDLKNAVLETIKTNRYFPNVNEIIQNIKPKSSTWMDKEITKEPLSNEEQKELEELLK